MGNFLRFVALVALVLIGFGTGICGLIGLGGVAVDVLNGHGSSGEDFTGVAIAFSLVALVIAALCAWGIRALARRLRTTPQPVAAASSTPPPPSSPLSE